MPIPLLARSRIMAEIFLKENHSWRVAIRKGNVTEYGRIRAAASIEEALSRASIAGGEIISCIREEI